LPIDEDDVLPTVHFESIASSPNNEQTEGALPLSKLSYLDLAVERLFWSYYLQLLYYIQNTK